MILYVIQTDHNTSVDFMTRVMDTVIDKLQLDHTTVDSLELNHTFDYNRHLHDILYC